MTSMTTVSLQLTKSVRPLYLALESL